jgi:transcription initiation factor TFIID TATA-box-binding protein
MSGFRQTYREILESPIPNKNKDTTLNETDEFPTLDESILALFDNDKIENVKDTKPTKRVRKQKECDIAQIENTKTTIDMSDIVNTSATCTLEPCNIECYKQYGAEGTGFLDLRFVTYHLKNAIYKPNKFKAITVKVNKPKATVMVFDSENLVITGAKNEQENKIVARLIGRKIQKMRYSNIKFRNFQMQNMVANYNFGFCVNLDALKEIIRKSECIYYASLQTKLFPALMIQVWESRSKAKCLVFRSGKMIITGEKTLAQINEVFSIVRGLMMEHKEKIIFKKV